jgi:hypothetical protein
MKRDTCLQSLPFITYRVHRKGTPLQVPLTELPYRERYYIARALLQLIFKVPGRRTPLSRSPNGAPLWRGTHPRTFFST